MIVSYSRLIESAMHRMVMPLVIVCCIGCGANQKHPVGKDTVESFGDGTYQVVRVLGQQVFVDIEHQRELVHDVKAWRRSDDDVYVLGADGQMVVVNLVSGHQKSSKRPQDFSEKEWAIFERLRR